MQSEIVLNTVLEQVSISIDMKKQMKGTKKIDLNYICRQQKRKRNQIMQKVSFETCNLQHL